MHVFPVQLAYKNRSILQSIHCEITTKKQVIRNKGRKDIENHSKCFVITYPQEFYLLETTLSVELQLQILLTPNDVIVHVRYVIISLGWLSLDDGYYDISHVYYDILWRR